MAWYTRKDLRYTDIQVSTRLPMPGNADFPSRSPAAPPPPPENLCQPLSPQAFFQGNISIPVNIRVSEIVQLPTIPGLVHFQHDPGGFAYCLFSSNQFSAPSRVPVPVAPAIQVAICVAFGAPVDSVLDSLCTTLAFRWEPSGNNSPQMGRVQKTMNC